MDELKLLVVDDQAAICKLIEDIGIGVGYETRSANSVAEFKEIYLSFRPVIIFLDLQLNENDGVELLRYLAGEQSQAKIVIMSGHESKVLSTALRLGKAQGLRMLTSLQKPINIATITEILEQAKINFGIPTGAQLAKAIEMYDLVLHYQPKIDLKTQKLVGVEALVRWQPPLRSNDFP